MRFSVLACFVSLLAAASQPATISAADPAAAHTQAYLDAARLWADRGAPFDSGSEKEGMALLRFQQALADFKADDFPQRIRNAYAESIFFNDTLKTIATGEELEQYFAATADALEVGEVEFLDVVSNNGDYYVRWKMSLQFKKLDKGTLHTSVGMSHIRFDEHGKVVLHQDFWDSSAGFFEHLPGFGWMLRAVKNRL